MKRTIRQARKWYGAGLTVMVLVAAGYLVWENQRPEKAYARWFGGLAFMDRMLVLEEMNNSGCSVRFELSPEDLQRIHDYLEDLENQRLLGQLEGNQLVMAQGIEQWRGQPLKKYPGEILEPGRLEEDQFEYVKLDEADRRGLNYRKLVTSYGWRPARTLAGEAKGDILDNERDNAKARDFLDWMGRDLRKGELTRYRSWSEELMILGIEVPLIDRVRMESGIDSYVLHRAEPQPRIERLKWAIHGVAWRMINGDEPRTATANLGRMDPECCEICEEPVSEERPINFCLVCGKKHCHGVTGVKRTNEFLLMACSSLSQCRDETVK